MSREDSYLTADMHDMFKHTVLVRHTLEEQFHDVEHQTNTATLGMWLFLATEVMFFGADLHGPEHLSLPICRCV